MNGRAVVSVAVLAGWSAGLALLAQRELDRSPREALAEAAVRVSPGAEYFLVEHGASHVGFASTTIDTVPDGLQITHYRVVDAGTGGAGRIAEQVSIQTSRALLLRQVRRSVTGAGLAGTLTATTIGDSVVRVVQSRPGAVDDTLWRSFDAPLLLPSLVPLAIALGERPAPGDVQTFSVFDPEHGSVERRRYRVRAESTLVVLDSAVYDSGTRRWRGVHADSTLAWHVVADDGGLDAWVDERGAAVRARRDSHVLRRAAYELAFENWRSTADTVPLLAGAGAGDPAVFTAERDTVFADSMRVRVDGLDLARLDVRSPTQRDSGQRVVVRRYRLTNASPEFWLPMHRRMRERYAPLLKVEPMIDPLDPAIVAHARRLRRRENDPRVVARVLAAWVGDSVALRGDMPVSTASVTVRSRAGDAAAHANLFVALARASDVPSRVVSGVVMQGGAPRYHVWAEVNVGDWIPVDPTVGQFPADARRLRLVIGGAGAADELRRVIARARWETPRTWQSR